MQHNQPSKKTILVIGATGGVGGAVARAFLTAGWHVRALTRRVDAATMVDDDLAGVEWQLGDAMIEADVVRAAHGVDCIFHGANPPRYQRWRELAIPMLASSIAAAHASGARLILPAKFTTMALMQGR